MKKQKIKKIKYKLNFDNIKTVEDIVGVLKALNITFNTTTDSDWSVIKQLKSLNLVKLVNDGN